MQNSSSKILILGALSAIAAAYSRLRAREGAALVLAGRDAARLNILAAELRELGASQVICHAADLAKVDGIDAMLGSIQKAAVGLDEVVIAYGQLGDQLAMERDPVLIEEQVRNNFLSPVIWLSAAVNHLEGNEKARIIVLGSVAGDRGRRANALYGATKAALQTYSEAMAQRRGSPAIITIKLGPVDTPLVAHLDRSVKLNISPEQAASAIAKAVNKRKRVAYVPGYWRFIMFAIRLLPSRMMDRIKS